MVPPSWKRTRSVISSRSILLKAGLSIILAHRTIVRAATPRYGKLGKNKQIQSWHKMFVHVGSLCTGTLNRFEGREASFLGRALGLRVRPDQIKERLYRARKVDILSSYEHGLYHSMFGR
ncbi:hypothetical protein [Bradyrhizobium sp. RT5a]|uniref:hypothetical protein n=1 Tax=unclassified Bradyrhizobium TaxID=2631580 RepID=UPI0033916F7E